MTHIPRYNGIMEHENYFNPGDLVHLREWNDGSGWVISRSITFMVIDDTRPRGGGRVVRAVGGGYNIKTLGVYFVRVAE